MRGVLRILGVAVAFGSGLEVVRGQEVLWTYGSTANWFTDLDRCGDYDGDGVQDVVIYDEQFKQASILSGRDGSLLQTFSQTATDLGSVAGIGDQDGDGVPDILFGDPDYTAGIYKIGRVLGISGKTGNEFFSAFGFSAARDYCGQTVHNMGDLNGDGLVDFAWGTYTTGWTGPSRIDVNYTIRQGAVVLPGNFTGQWPVVPIGDVDGVKGNDVAASYIDPTTKIGTVGIFAGRSLNLLATISGQSIHEYFGNALATCGDVDGDGVGEILIGAPYRKSHGGIETGAVIVVSSKNGAPLYEIDGETDQQAFGSSLEHLEDVDGDGVDDFIVASNGPYYLQIFSAATSRMLVRFSDIGGLTRNVGDLDGDGRADIVGFFGQSVVAHTVPYLTLASVAPSRQRFDRVPALTLTGSGFAMTKLAPTVQIGGLDAQGVQVTSDSSLTCTAPSLPPGSYDVTVDNGYSNATLAGGLTLVPWVFVDGVPTLGSTLDLHYEFETLDSTLAIFGFPPELSIGTPPFGGTLGIAPFFTLFVLTSWPSDEFVSTVTIPSNPALSGMTFLLQSLSGPVLAGSGRDGAWSNVASVTIQ
jgi:hypothetical protein